MLTNFNVIDERIDNYAGMIDGNLETIRKQLNENRDVFINCINKSSLDLEERINGIVDDLENLANQQYENQANNDTGEGAAADAAVFSKQLNDLEAQVNTAIITEKSVRKAQDKHLAEQLDIFSK